MTEEVKSKRPRMFSSSSIPQYFRELSIVIIGVLITLSITSVINDCTRQKEIREMFKFIKVELEENIENLQWIQDRWEGEQYIFKLMLEGTDKLNQIPVDTLEKYRYAVGTIYNFTKKDDSYELLKNSLLIQYVKDKDLLRHLSKIYGRLDNLKAQLSSYTSQKRGLFLEPAMEEMNEDEFRIWSEGNIYELFDFMARKNGFRKFAVTGKTILSPPSIFDDCKNKIRETINIMEQKGF